MVKEHGHRVASVAPHSPAERIGVRAGDIVLSVNAEPLIDEIDYQDLTSGSRLDIRVMRDGQAILLKGEKADWESAGLSFENNLLGPIRQCANRCVFCFIDQMPPGLRSSLYVKDDDWRRSLMYGTYITLTNIGENEFRRLLRRKPSPLYISVHATDPEVRERLLGNKNAGKLLERLEAIAKAGIRFHSQIVLCPGLNDWAVLERTLTDLAGLYPAAQSAAIVPVGLTKYREGLAFIPPFNAESASAALGQITRIQQRCLRDLGTRFAFPSDEFYCLSGVPLPPEEAYEDYQQIENGVGLLRLFQSGWRDAIRELGVPKIYKPIDLACGVSFAPFARELFAQAGICGVQTLAVANSFFGPSVTVSGLLTGRDLLPVIKKSQADTILISKNMLREGANALFLDDMTLDQLCGQSGKIVLPIEPDGYALAEALHGYGGAS